VGSDGADDNAGAVEGPAEGGGGPPEAGGGEPEAGGRGTEAGGRGTEVRRPSRRPVRQRRRRLLRVGGGLLLLVMAVAVGVAVHDVAAARRHLVSARTTLAQALSRTSALETVSGRAATAQALDAALGQVSAAEGTINRSLPLRAARLVPLLSRQHRGLTRLVGDSRAALVAGRVLLTQVSGLAEQGKVIGAQVPLPAVAAMESSVRSAGSTIAVLSRPGGGLWGPLGRARRDFNRLADSTGRRLLGDADSLGVAQRLMGGAGNRRYFVALENNAEMRDQGAVLSYAIVTFDHGRVQVTEQGPILTPVQVPGQNPTASLLLKSPAPTAIPAGTAAVFGSTFPTQTWQSVNTTADFAWSSQAMVAMYHQATGQRVDGVVALDVPALSALLDVVGPVSIPGLAQPISAANAATVVLRDLYAAYAPDQQIVRKELLSAVVTEVVNRLKTSTFDPVPLAQQLATAALGGHMRLWSADAGEEQVLERNQIAGGPAVISPTRTFHVAVENRTATKLDYYVGTTTKQDIAITAAGTAIIATTIEVHNGAPVGAKPSYALGPDGFGTKKPGEYGAWVLMWGPAGSNQPGSVVESGLNLSQDTIQPLQAGETKQVRFITVIDNAVVNGAFQLRYVPQPRLDPPTLDVTISADGWKITGAPTFNGPWSQTLTLHWTLGH